MLAVLTADGSRFDAGSLALALARRWSDSGEPVLFVDADATGPRLAQRLGGAVYAEYSPAQRGLPSLMVSREPLTLRVLAGHCYSLDTSAGSLWALFGPHHRAGAELAAGWLASRSAELAEMETRRGVVVSSSLRAGADRLAPVLRAGAVVVVAPVENVEAAKGLWSLMRDLGLSGQRCRHRALIVEGDSAVSDEEIGIEAGMHVAGRLPVVEDDVVLRLQGGRRERAFTNAVDQIARRLLAFSRLVASDSRTSGTAGAHAGAGLPAMGQQPLGAGVNGARAAPEHLADRTPGHSREAGVSEGRG